MQLQTMYRLDAPTTRELLSLRQACHAADGTSGQLHLSTELNFDPTIPPFYLAYEGGHLAAYLSLFLPEQGQAEVNAFTHPEYRRQGYFKALYTCAQRECSAKGIKTFLFVVDASSKSGQDTVRAAGLASGFSEYQLRLVRPIPYREEVGLSFRPVERSDRHTYLRITSLALDIGEEAPVFLEAILSGGQRRGYLAFWNQTPVGVCHISYVGEEACIYGLGLLEPYRGRGWGRHFVAYACREAAGCGMPIVIEVESENQRAYRLYCGCGFEVVRQIDYYPSPVTWPF